MNSFGRKSTVSAGSSGQNCEDDGTNPSWLLPTGRWWPLTLLASVIGPWRAEVSLLAAEEGCSKTTSFPAAACTMAVSIDITRKTRGNRSTKLKPRTSGWRRWQRHCKSAKRCFWNFFCIDSLSNRQSPRGPMPFHQLQPWYSNNALVILERNTSKCSHWRTVGPASTKDRWTERFVPILFHNALAKNRPECVLGGGYQP